MHINVDMEEEDFERLSHSAMRWSGLGWEQQDGRFENCTPGKTPNAAPNYRFAMAYWVGDEWINVMFATAYLKAQGEPYELLWDLAGTPDSSYVIVTNYTTSIWNGVPA
jgi:hypothetical protein